MLLCNKSTIKTHPLLPVVNDTHLNKIKYLCYFNIQFIFIYWPYLLRHFFVLLLRSSPSPYTCLFISFDHSSTPEIDQWKVPKGIKAHCILYSWLQRFLWWNICWFAELYLFKGDHLTYIVLHKSFLFNLFCLFCFVIFLYHLYNTYCSIASTWGLAQVVKGSGGFMGGSSFKSNGKKKKKRKKKIPIKRERERERERAFCSIAALFKLLWEVGKYHITESFHGG